MPIPVPANIPWKAIGVAVCVLALVVGVLMYGNAKYNAGKTDADNAWKAAAARLEAQSQGAADAANKPADKREADFAAKLETEKEKVDEAIARGDSPADALFGVQPATDRSAVTP